MNILITGHDTFHNRGCQALVYSTTEILRRAFPDASFTVLSWEPEHDGPRMRADHPEIPCRFVRHRFQVGEFSRRNRFWMSLRRAGIQTDRILRTQPRLYEAIKECDLLVVSGGDILGDYGDESIRHYLFPVAVAQAMGKPVHVFAQSISPHRSGDIREFVRAQLDRAALITVRERLSFDYVKSIGVSAPLHLTADPAFLLHPAPAARVGEILRKEGLGGAPRPWIGVSVSETATRWGGGDQEGFKTAVGGGLDRLIELNGGSAVFVPHVVHPGDKGNDDRLVSKAVVQGMKERGRAAVLEGDYSCEELKGVIGACDLFIGTRTHATIAAASQAVPTLAIAYSAKAYGIMEDVLDRDRCTIDVKDVTEERLAEKAADLLAGRASAANSIEGRLDGIKARAFENGRLIAEALGRRRQVGPVLSPAA